MPFSFFFFLTQTQNMSKTSLKSTLLIDSNLYQFEFYSNQETQIFNQILQGYYFSPKFAIMPLVKFLHKFVISLELALFQMKLLLKFLVKS